MLSNCILKELMKSLRVIFYPAMEFLHIRAILFDNFSFRAQVLNVGQKASKLYACNAHNRSDCQATNCNDCKKREMLLIYFIICPVFFDRKIAQNAKQQTARI